MRKGFAVLSRLAFALGALAFMASFSGCPCPPMFPSCPIISFEKGAGLTHAGQTLKGGAKIIVKYSVSNELYQKTQKNKAHLKKLVISLRKDGEATTTNLKTLDLTGFNFGPAVDTFAIRDVPKGSDEFIFYAEDEKGISETRTIKVTISP